MQVVPDNLNTWKDIPFLPIEFFKTHKVLCGSSHQIIFESSGTGGNTSSHYVSDRTLYESSFINGFKSVYGEPSDYCFCCLLPSYLERDRSSLIYMAKELVARSDYEESDFFLDDFGRLYELLLNLKNRNVPTILIGVSFALVDFVEKYSLDFPNLIVMETGGMKGRRRELTRPELHAEIRSGFGVDKIHSEYGMTELLSQAYSTGDGIFNTPHWMKIVIREVTDPATFMEKNQSGLINVIDLANIHSCSFIATQDLGRIIGNNAFEILGRLDNSDIRGCNLMIESA